MFKTMGWAEIVLVLVIVLLVFGVGRISKIAGELGEGIRAFKVGISGEKHGDTNGSHSESIDENEH